jgi:hypothetical protein
MILTKRHYLIAGGATLLAAVLTVSAVTLRYRAEPVTLPERTPILVTLDQSLASNQNLAGDHFDATVSEPVIVEGKTVIPQGAHAEGLVVDARKSGRLMGRARLQLALQTDRTTRSAPPPGHALAVTTRNATGRGSAEEPPEEP